MNRQSCTKDQQPKVRISLNNILVCFHRILSCTTRKLGIYGTCRMDHSVTLLHIFSKFGAGRYSLLWYRRVCVVYFVNFSFCGPKKKEWHTALEQRLGE